MEKYVNEITIEKVKSVITIDLVEIKEQKTIYDALKGEIPYHEIQLAIAVLKSRAKSK